MPMPDTLGSRFIVIVLIALIGLILAAGFYLFVEPSYQATASLPQPDNPVLLVTCGNCEIGCSLEPPDKYWDCWSTQCETVCG